MDTMITQEPAQIALAAPVRPSVAEIMLSSRAAAVRANAQFLAACRDREAQWAASPIFRAANGGAR